MEKVALWTGRVARLGLWTAGIGLVLMTALIAAQVFWRYILNDSIVWTEPASVMIMGWFIFLGAAVGIREGYHLSFDVVLYVLPHRIKMILFSISDIAVSLFGFGMVWFGWQLATKTAGNKLPSLGISGAFDFAPIVAGGVLIVLFSVERVFRRAAGMHTARFGSETENM
ncbi:TRAP transporter small permease [Sulfitobacter porphyrae]|uniref:TRAP transporter small permease protein n=1 Tax=Sulfitobacter porphyrae TaxID=1246864 RepID=A0ABW2BA34_9RHOB|nr:C4-dicarboxylate ABC transporter [Sulfitobacter porphyrae]